MSDLLKGKSDSTAHEAAQKLHSLTVWVYTGDLAPSGFSGLSRVFFRNRRCAKLGSPLQTAGFSSFFKVPSIEATSFPL